MDGQPVGKAMKEGESNLLQPISTSRRQHQQTMTSRRTTKELLKNTLQYQPDDRPTMKQVMEQLSQLKEQIVRIGDFEVIVNGQA